jgi:acetylxylan esterase
MQINRFRDSVLVFLGLGLFAAHAARAAQLTQVGRSTWTGGVTLPSYVEMYIYAPDKLAANPPIVVSSHSCGSTATGQMGNMTKTKAAADKNGFIMILPDNPGQNCWDVGSKQSLTHDGGGDTHAVAQMVRYALTKYSADPKRVYAVGGSSGGMMTQALLGVYPEIFMAGAARAGVPCGCWADSYAASNQWSGTCAGGSVSKTAQQWGDLVRGINPDYKGHRPRVQLYQGESDETISYKNMGESIKEWTNVLGLATTPTSTDTITSSGYSYDRQFWKNTCGFTVLEAWSAPGQKHSMTYEEDAILKFFGLDVVSGQDPELAACGGGTGGASGAGGGGGSGGTTGASGSGGSTDGGSGGQAGGADASGAGGDTRLGGGGATATGGGGTAGTGGNPGTGGSIANGGSAGGQNASGTGGSVPNPGSTAGSAGGAQGSGGRPATGGSSGSSVSAGNGGSSSATTGADSSPGCSCALGSGARPGWGSALLLAAITLFIRGRRRTQAQSNKHHQEI